MSDEPKSSPPSSEKDLSKEMEIVLSAEKCAILNASLLDFAKISRFRFQWNGKGFVKNQDSETEHPITVKNIGPGGLVFVSKTRFFKSSKVLIKLQFPTNDLQLVGKYVMGEALHEVSLLPLWIIKEHSFEEESDLFTYETDFLPMNNLETKNLKRWLSFLLIKEMGLDKVSELIASSRLPDAPEKENRIWERIETNVEMSLFDDIDFKEGKGTFLDISQTGARVKSNETFNIGQTVLLKFILPKQEKDMRFPCLIQWCKALPEENAWEIGLHFQIWDASILQILEFFLYSLKKEQEQEAEEKIHKNIAEEKAEEKS